MILRDKTDFPDELLPVIYDQNIERLCAPICIDEERSGQSHYGTRTHSVILLKKVEPLDSKNQLLEGLFVEVNRYKAVTGEESNLTNVSYKIESSRNDIRFSVNL
jgi:uncharacterized protein with NRDE domain